MIGVLHMDNDRFAAFYPPKQLVLKLLFWIGLFLTLDGFAIDHLPSLAIKNFSKIDYNADNQNWAVASDKEGTMYFANNRGLLEFDGISWKLYPSPKGNILRSVAVDEQGLIYTSGYREFGCWQRTPSGSLKYHSFKPLAEKDFIPNVEFWKIIAHSGKIYFHSFMQMFVMEKDAVIPILLPSFSNTMADVDGKIIIDQPDGLYQVSGNRILPFLTGEFFRGKQVRFFFQVEQGQFIIGTFSDGIFRYDGKQFKLFHPGLNDFFIRNKVNQAILSADGTLTVGTHLGGVVAFDKFANLIYEVSTQNGLQNNTVLGLAADRNGNIWQALDNGIDFTTFRGKSSCENHPVKDIGSVYTAALFHRKLYLGTNQGLYVKEETAPDADFRLIPQSEGQVWSCIVLKDKLLIGHNNGTFLVTDQGLRKISGVNGVFAFTPDEKRAGILLQSTYSDLVALDFTGSEPRLSGSLGNFNELIQFVESDLYGNIWAGHMHRGIFKLKLSENREKVIRSIYYGENSPFRKDFGIHPFKIEDRIVFTTGEQLYTYDELRDSIVVYKELNLQLGTYANADRIFPATNHYYWFIANQSVALIHIQENKVSVIREFPYSLFNNQIIGNFENIIPISDTEAIICLGNGYAFLNAALQEPESPIRNAIPELKEFITTDQRGVSDTIPKESKVFTIGNNRSSAMIRFAMPLFNADRIVFRSFLEGIDPNWRSGVANPTFRFERLPVGIYTLWVKAVDPWGNSSKTASLSIRVLPQWYMTIWAKLGLAILIVLLLFWFRLRVIRLTHQKSDRQREEKERELIRLRNEKLQNDITYKSQELANSTMSIIKKNEFLIELKKELKQQKSQLETRFPDKYYLKLIRKIDENIASHDDWKTFENHFERAHEEFFKRLKLTYPKLTPGDLRLCAYLRMNLSSKEIAPLLGISVRGLENHRYRLRKKMGLEMDANLNEVMMNVPTINVIRQEE